MSDFPLRCLCRRKAETSLRCARCNAPICPDCSRFAAVGHICRSCASNRRSPLYQVSAQSLALAFVACLPAAMFGGWLLSGLFGGFGGFFSLWIAFLYGLGIAEVALRVTGRKRGLQMAVVVGACIAVGIGAGWLLHGVPVPPNVPVPNALIWHLSNPWSLVTLAVAEVAGVSRVKDL